MKEFGYTFGYARVSTFHQNLERQLELFKRLGINDEHIFEDKISGKDFDRPGLNRLKMEVERGDTVYIYCLSRLGRSTKNLLEEIEWFKRKGIKVISHEDNLELTNLSDEAFRVLASIVEREYELIKERTEAGRFESGNLGGRPRINKKNIERVEEIVADGFSVKESCEIVGISPNTFYRHRTKQAE